MTSVSPEVPLPVGAGCQSQAFRKERRADLLRAGLNEFAQRGYEHTSMIRSVERACVKRRLKH